MATGIAIGVSALLAAGSTIYQVEEQRKAESKAIDVQKEQAEEAERLAEEKAVRDALLESQTDLSKKIGEVTLGADEAARRKKATGKRALTIESIRGKVDEQRPQLGVQGPERRTAGLQL